MIFWKNTKSESTVSRSSQTNGFLDMCCCISLACKVLMHVFFQHVLWGDGLVNAMKYDNIIQSKYAKFRNRHSVPSLRISESQLWLGICLSYSFIALPDITLSWSAPNSVPGTSSRSSPEKAGSTGDRRMLRVDTASWETDASSWNDSFCWDWLDNSNLTIPPKIKEGNASGSYCYPTQDLRRGLRDSQLPTLWQRQRWNVRSKSIQIIHQLQHVLDF